MAVYRVTQGGDANSRLFRSAEREKNAGNKSTFTNLPVRYCRELLCLFMRSYSSGGSAGVLAGVAVMDGPLDSLAAP